MEEMILIGYEWISVLLPAIAVIGVFGRIYRKKEMAQSRLRIMWLLVFAVYLFGVYHYTGAGTLFDAKRYGLELTSLNFMPFSDPGFDIVGYGLNVVLFVPFGFLMPLIWERLNQYRYAAGLGALFSVWIEASQLFNIRATDIDDVILNTAGAVLGMLLFRLVSGVIGRKPVQTDTYRYEILVYVGVTFFGRFLLFDEFGMAQLLYGF